MSQDSVELPLPYLLRIILHILVTAATHRVRWVGLNFRAGLKVWKTMSNLS